MVRVDPPPRQENVPYDKLVEGIVLAVGRRPDQSYDDYCAEMSALLPQGQTRPTSPRATTMPYFWTRKALGKPEDKALASPTPSWASACSAPSATSTRTTSGPSRTSISSRRSSTASRYGDGNRDRHVER